MKFKISQEKDSRSGFSYLLLGLPPRYFVGSAHANLRREVLQELVDADRNDLLTTTVDPINSKNVQLLR